MLLLFGFSTDEKLHSNKLPLFNYFILIFICLLAIPFVFDFIHFFIAFFRFSSVQTLLFITFSSSNSHVRKSPRKSEMKMIFVSFRFIRLQFSLFAFAPFLSHSLSRSFAFASHLIAFGFVEHENNYSSVSMDVSPSGILANLFSLVSASFSFSVQLSTIWFWATRARDT